MGKAHQPSSENDSDEEIHKETRNDETPVKETDQPLPKLVLDKGFRSVVYDWMYRNIREISSLKILVLALLVCFSAYYVSSYKDSHEKKEMGIDRKSAVLKYIDHLKSEYGHQDSKLWIVIESQIAEYLNHSTAPLTIVLVYKDAVKTAKLLASEVSRVAVELKHDKDLCGDMDLVKIGDTASVIIDRNLLEEKLSTVDSCKKLLIFNLQNLRPSDAADLHSLLDPDFPNVKNAVYIFTIKIAVESERSIYYSVNNLLKERWGTELHADKLEPLLSRLVNFVKVQPEPLIDL